MQDQGFPLGNTIWEFNTGRIWRAKQELHSGPWGFLQIMLLWESSWLLSMHINQLNFCSLFLVMANNLGQAIRPSPCPVLWYIFLQSLMEASGATCTNRTGCELLQVGGRSSGRGKLGLMSFLSPSLKIVRAPSKKLLDWIEWKETELTVSS